MFLWKRLCKRLQCVIIFIPRVSKDLAWVWHAFTFKKLDIRFPLVNREPGRLEDIRTLTIIFHACPRILLGFGMPSLSRNLKLVHREPGRLTSGSTLCFEPHEFLVISSRLHEIVNISVLLKCSHCVQILILFVQSDAAEWLPVGKDLLQLRKVSV